MTEFVFGFICLMVTVIGFGIWLAKSIDSEEKEAERLDNLPYGE